MPRIELIEPVLHGPNDPFHWEHDNLPLQSILQRQTLINLTVDNIAEQMRDAIGTAGSFSNRLNQSLEQSGGLKTSAVDEALHSIENHTDTENFVRMTKAQSEKLDEIDEDANKLSFKISNATSTTNLPNGVITLESSPTVEVRAESNQKVSMHFNFPEEAAHRHYWDQTPVDSDALDPDYINYKVNSMGTPYISGSLKVIVNGLTLSKDSEIYVPASMVNDPWTLLSYTENESQGSFELSTMLSEDDVIKIDYTISLVGTDGSGS